MELHSNAGHRRLQEVGVQRVKVPSFVGAELLGHSHLQSTLERVFGVFRIGRACLGTRARIKCALEPLSVDNGTSSNVDNPADNEQGHKAKHCKERIPVVPEGARLHGSGKQSKNAKHRTRIHLNPLHHGSSCVLVLSHFPAALSLKPDSQVAQVS